MAARKSTRGARSHARSANRPRTHPDPHPKGDAVRPELPADVVERLDDLRRALSQTVSVVNVCYAALEEQRSGRDLDVADVLRQCVSNKLFEQVEQLYRLIGRSGT